MRASEPLVCTLGDLLLDVVVRLSEPLAAAADASAETVTGAGGQAANVAAWVAALGGRSRFVGARSRDPGGRLAEEGLAGRGVDVVGPIVAERGGVVVSLVAPDGDRTMATDRGAAPMLRADQLDRAWFVDAAALHLSGYSLLREPMREAAHVAAGHARASGARVSIDLSSWTAIRTVGAARFQSELRRLAPDVVFTTERELETLGDRAVEATWVVKRGPEGCVVEANGTRLELPADPAAVVDTTGAGDALAAGFLLGGSLEEATRRGLAAAAICIARPGAMP